MRKIYIAILTTAAAMGAQAQVNNTPGNLSNLVEDTQVAALTVTGQMDARDFKFIASSLNNLESLDLSNVEIVAYENLSTATIGNEYSFAAGTVPTMALAGKQKLTTVALPLTAHAIGEAALAACPALTTVTMGDSVLTVGDYAFSSCTALESITLPGSITTVGQGAFSRCSSLATLTVEASDKAQALTIGNEAFLDCQQLNNVNLGEKVTSIGDAAFAGTGLQVLDLSAYPNLETLGNWVYTKTGITSATLPASLKSMGNGLFLYNEALASVTLPEGINTLGDFALAGNAALTDVNLGKVEHIGDYALYGASAMEKVTIPESVTFMGTQAMAGMTGLVQINALPEQVPALGSDVWAGVDQPAVRLVASQDAASDYAAAEQWKEFHVVYSKLLGDADDNMQLNITDINLLINYINLRITSLPEQSDANQDGVINISDINLVINYIQNRDPYSYIYIEPNTTDLVSIEDFSIAPGEERDIDIVLENAELCSDMQCDINLPEGLTVVSVAPAQRASKHIISSSTQDNSVRILCYSLTSQEISGNNGAVMTLRVKADEALNSQSTITVDNVVLAHLSHPALYAAATQTNVNNTSGVDDINAQGYKVYASNKTLYIVAPENGSAQLVAMNGSAQPLDLHQGTNTLELGTGVYVVRVGNKSHKVVIK